MTPTPKPQPEETSGMAVRRTCAVLRLLAGHETYGLRLTDVAENLKLDASTAGRYLEALRQEGFVVKLEHDDKRWALARAFLSIAEAYQSQWARTDMRRSEHRQGVRAGAASLIQS